MECEVCYGSGEVCSECECPEGQCNCPEDLNGEPPEIMSCPECDGDGFIDDEDEDDEEYCSECGDVLNSNLTCNNCDDIESDDDDDDEEVNESGY